MLRTAPPAGTVLEAGETLTVYINREELAVGSTIAPSCVGLGQNEAGRLLTSRGLSYSFIKVDSASPAGYVVSQSPRGAKAWPGRQRDAARFERAGRQRRWYVQTRMWPMAPSPGTITLGWPGRTENGYAQCAMR